jgi:GTP cyclohydrolase I
MTSKAIIAIGSNIAPKENVPDGLKALNRHPAIEVRSCSPVYVTAPIGNPDDPHFHNAAARIVTELPVEELREALRGIEAALGRVRTDDKNAPRTVDLDIVWYEGFEGTVGGQVIPDPDVPKRPYLAIPIADVAPDIVFPPTGETFAAIAAAMDPTSEEIRPLMANDIVPINHNARYATETRMEAVANEVYDPEMESTVRAQLELLGEDPEREGLIRTPLRVAKAMDFLTSGYTTTLDDVVNNAIFDGEGAEEMVIVKDVEFYSLCEHHMLPFFGNAAVAYLPNSKIIGLSKVARVVDLFSRRLQVQERLTNQIADAMIEVLDPHGVAVVMEGSHFCMMMRGVQKQGSAMVTSAMRGSFKENPRTRAEFMDHLKR